MCDRTDDEGSLEPGNYICRLPGEIIGSLVYTQATTLYKPASYLSTLSFSKWVYGSISM